MEESGTERKERALSKATKSMSVTTWMTFVTVFLRGGPSRSSSCSQTFVLLVLSVAVPVASL
eukprot:2463627-Rhodomonas_salina.1